MAKNKKFHEEFDEAIWNSDCQWEIIIRAPKGYVFVEGSNNRVLGHHISTLSHSEKVPWYRTAIKEAIQDLLWEMNCNLTECTDKHCPHCSEK